MTEFLMSGSAYFPGWLSIVFSVGLGLGIVHHLPCLISGHGNRWFHGGHAVMALSMIYMYLSMSYEWTWLPASWQMWFFVGTSLAVGGYLALEVTRGKPVNFLWIPLLIGQASMIYMWYPMMRWNAIAIFVLVSWFAVETVGWAANLLPDDSRRRVQSPWFPYEFTATPVGVTAGAMATSGSAGHDADHESAPDCHAAAQLSGSDWKDRTLMAVMALSMGYMFYGMELMRWSMAAGAM